MKIRRRRRKKKRRRRTNLVQLELEQEHSMPLGCEQESEEPVEMIFLKKSTFNDKRRLE